MAGDGASLLRGHARDSHRGYSRSLRCAIGLRPRRLKLPILLVGLVVLQAAFGMWTVTLKLWPQVVTTHLLGGFATLSLLWLSVFARL